MGVFCTANKNDEYATSTRAKHNAIHNKQHQNTPTECGVCKLHRTKMFADKTVLPKDTCQILSACTQFTVSAEHTLGSPVLL